jgi:hypothetical protein
MESSAGTDKEFCSQMYFSVNNDNAVASSAARRFRKVNTCLKMAK